MRRAPKQTSVVSRLVACSVAVVAASAVAASPAAAQGKSAAAQSKVTVCHARGNGSYASLTVNANALPAHLAHGDVLQPNGSVPGSPGFVFDGACRPVVWDYAVNANLDPSAQTPSGTLLVGTGIPASGFGLAINPSAGIELGLGVIYRQGPSVASIDDYADGMLEFDVADGPQSTANGSSPNNVNRAAWSFNWSIATGLGGSLADLGDYTFQLLYDVDPGPGTSYRTLTMEPGGVGSSGYQWRDQGTGIVFVGDDGGNANVTQNSENYAFGFFQTFLTGPYGPGSGFAGPAQFDIILQAYDGAQLIARNHVVVNVQ